MYASIFLNGIILFLWITFDTHTIKIFLLFGISALIKTSMYIFEWIFMFYNFFSDWVIVYVYSTSVQYITDLHAYVFDRQSGS